MTTALGRALAALQAEDAGKSQGQLHGQVSGAVAGEAKLVIQLRFYYSISRISLSSVCIGMHPLKAMLVTSWVSTPRVAMPIT